MCAGSFCNQVDQGHVRLHFPRMSYSFAIRNGYGMAKTLKSSVLLGSSGAQEVLGFPWMHAVVGMALGQL